jgi:hypothetical protein
VVCSSQSTEQHHVKTRGSGGTDDPWNLMPVCRRDHTRIHQEGLAKVAKGNLSLLTWLVENGWVFNKERKQWRHLAIPQSLEKEF